MSQGHGNWNVGACVFDIVVPHVWHPPLEGVMDTTMGSKECLPEGPQSLLISVSQTETEQK